MPSLNPFRNPLPASSSQSGTSLLALSPVPTGTSTVSDTTTAISPSPSPSPDILDEELPPAYTPAADSRHGEHTIEYGPTRPFQNTVRSPRHAPATQSTGWSASRNLAVPNSQHAPSRLGSSQSNSPSQSTCLQPNVVPPLPPRPNTSPVSPTSEFARDFYAAGSGESETSRYAPPPGPPPSQRPSSSEDEGRPTTKPTPGHPLLSRGRILVYPPGYECDKCHNIGYKQNDPSHPCRKCWSKFAKPFTGAITYSSFKASSAGSGKTFQRPLPVLRPAGASRSQRNSGYPGSTYAQNLGPAQNTLYAPPPLPPPGPSPPQNRLYAPPPLPPPGPSPSPSIRMMPSGPFGAPQPPPGSVVYNAGDPRLGGSQCLSCDGDGVVGGFFMQEQCTLCGGVGRTFY